MRALLLFLAIVPLCLFGQIFPGQTNVIVPPGAPSVTEGVAISEATVSGIDVLGGCTVLEQVNIDISHTWVGDVAIFLISPNGTVLELTSGNGGSANDWSGTQFRDDAPQNIVDGTAPYTGVFRPEGRQQDVNEPFPNTAPLETFTLANTFAGEDADGVWQLYVNDFVFADVGVINSWELIFSSSGTSTLDAELTVSDPDICAGASVNIGVTGTIPPTATFNWSTGASTQTISDNPTGPTLYAVTITDGGCTEELDVLVEPQVQPTISGPTTACGGDPVTLFATGDGPFTWSTGQTGTSISVSPTSTTTYTVSNGPGSCGTSADFIVTVQPISLTLQVSEASICAGASVTLEAIGGSPTATYQWSTGATTPLITPSPTSTQNYSVTLTENGCATDANFTVDVVETSVTLGPDETICAGETITITGTGTGPFQWSTGAVANAITVTPGTTTTYTATATSGSCSSSDQITLTVLATATVTASGAQTICAGESVTLSATGDGPFSWSTGASGDNITVSPLATETFTVTAGTGACAVSDDVTVTVTPIPTLDLGGDQTLCSGDATTLTATGSFSDILWDDGQTTPEIPLQATGTVTYTATASNGSCAVTESATITINEVPQVTVSGDETVCAGESVTLTATGPGPFFWTTGETTPSITVSPTTTTDYFVETTINGCTGFDGLVVNVEAAPTLDLGGDQTLCSGDATTLTATGSFSDILWDDGQTTAEIPLQASGTVTYTATASNGSCTVTESATITINEVPQVTVSGDETVCAGESVTLTATGPGPFFWTTGETTPSITVSPTTTTDYFVETTIDGCTGFDGLVVNVEAAPTLDLGGDRTFCEGEATTLTASGDFSTISWNGGFTTPTIDLHTTGTQTYTATAENGSCSVTESVTITIIANPIVTVSPDQTICAGDSVTLTATGTGPFSWSTGDVGESIRVSPETETVYSVSVGNVNCTATDEVRVSVAASPTVELGPDTVYCAGEAISLTASGNFSDIQWAGGQDQPTINLVEGTAVYRVTASLGSCSVADSVTITLLAEVTVDAGPDLTICQGDSINLTASGNGNFRWDNGAQSAAIRVAPLRDTTYIVQAGSGSCTVADTVAVTVLPLPIANLGPDITVCAATSTILENLSAADSYRWSTGDVTPELSVVVQRDTSYSLAVTTDGCTATDTITITALNPTLDLGADLTVCPGDSIILAAPPATNYAWNNGFTGATLRLAPPVDTSLSLAAVIDGCTVRDTVRVLVTNDLTLEFGADPAICPGDSITLTPQGSGPYAWSTGVTAAAITVAPEVTTRYVATVGTGNCAVTDSVEVVVQPAATVELGPEQTLCVGAETTLTPAGNGTSFRWSTGEVTPELNITPASSLTVGVLATTTEGCTAVDSVRLRVVTPLVSLAEVPEICPGDSLTLLAADAETYQWSTGATTPELSIAPTETTTFRVTGFTENCPAEDSVTVVVSPREAVAIDGQATICPGTETNLVATASAPVRWNDGSTGDILAVQPEQLTTYFAVAGTGNCADTATFTVNLFPEIITSVTDDLAICRGDSVSLLAAAGTAAIVWSDGDFAPDRNVRPEVTTTYRFVATENGCSAADSVRVTVNDLPELMLTSADCAPDNLSYSVTLTATGGAGPYLFNGATTGSELVINDVASGTSFMAEVVDANGCGAELSGQEDCGCPEVILGAAERGCNGSGESRDLSALLPAGAPAGSWSVLNPDANGLPAISNDRLTLLGAAAGTYTLQFTPDGAALECLPGYQTALEILDPPTAGEQPFVEERCVESAGTINLFAELSNAATGGTWEVIAADVTEGSAINLADGTFVATGQPAGDYRFRYRAPEGAGCPGGTAEVVVRLVEITVEGLAVPPSCEEECSGAVVVSQPNATWVYALDEEVPGGTTRFAGLCPGIYALTAEDDRGCRATTELAVPSVLSPASSVRAPQSIRLGDSTLLELQTNVETDSITWFPAGNCLTPDCRVVSVSPQETTVYRASFTSGFGCPGEAEATVIVDERVGAYVPNAFSPNGDGINDLLTVYAGEAVTAVENFRLFDRWGGQVVNFAVVPLGDDTFGWDGRSPQGQLLNAGVYVYQFTLTRVDGSSELVTGEVVLMR